MSKALLKSSMMRSVCSFRSNYFIRSFIAVCLFPFLNTGVMFALVLSDGNSRDARQKTRSWRPHKMFLVIIVPYGVLDQNPSDATLALLSIFENSRWRTIWQPICSFY